MPGSQPNRPGGDPSQTSSQGKPMEGRPTAPGPAVQSAGGRELFADPLCIQQEEDLDTALGLIYLEPRPEDSSPAGGSAAGTLGHSTTQTPFAALAAPKPSGAFSGDRSHDMRLTSMPGSQPNRPGGETSESGGRLLEMAGFGHEKPLEGCPIPRPPTKEELFADFERRLKEEDSDAAFSLNVPEPPPVVLSPEEASPASTSGTMQSPVAALTPAHLLKRDNTGEDDPRPQKSLEQAMKVTNDVNDGGASAVQEFYTNGTAIPLTANYIRLKLDPDRKVFSYSVQFTPSVDSSTARFAKLKEVGGVIGNAWTFDGSVLYLPFKLPSPRVMQFKLKDVEVTFEFLEEKELHYCVPLFNQLFNSIMSELQLYRIGRNFYDDDKVIDVPQHRLLVLPGYVVSVKECDGEVLVCCDSSSCVMNDQTVLQYIQVMRGRAIATWKMQLKDKLLGQSVLTNYNNHNYLIDDIDFDATPHSTFDLDGKAVTYKEYYKSQYGIEILDDEQPLLVTHLYGHSKVERHCCLVPELCYLVGITSEWLEDFNAKEAINECTRFTPSQRHFALQTYCESVHANPRACELLREWGLSLDTAAVQLEGRVMDRVVLEVFDKSVCTDSKVDWAKILNTLMYEPGKDLHDWIILFTQRDLEMTYLFVALLRVVALKMGFLVGVPDYECMSNSKKSTIRNRLNEIIRAKKKIDIIIVVTPTADKINYYSVIKQICCVKNHIPTQVISSRSISKPDPELVNILQRIALQINCKLGGSLWALRSPFRNCMVVGIDVYRVKKRCNRSVVSLVSSVNRYLNHWYSRACFQTPKQEVVSCFQPLFIDAVVEYHKLTGYFPERVIVYRDGVSDSHLDEVLAGEVQQLLSTFTQVDPKFNPKFTFVVLQKRVNTRFFSPRDGGVFSNPPSGTVVDQTVTGSNKFEFFMVSQHCDHGVANPTRYIVLYDNSNIGADELEFFTYMLCHMYFNYAGAIRVPAPVQYAHKLACLVGDHLKALPNPALHHVLFYL